MFRTDAAIVCWSFTYILCHGTQVQGLHDAHFNLVLIAENRWRSRAGKTLERLQILTLETPFRLTGFAA
jgi:hypothetical protein